MSATAAGATPEQKIPPGGANKPPEDPTKPAEGQVKVENKEKVENQVNAERIENQFNLFGERSQKRDPLADLIDDLPKLRADSPVFKAPQHDGLCKELGNNHIVLLMSDGEDAAYKAGHSLVSECAQDTGKKARTFRLRNRDKDREDLELHDLTDLRVLTEPQVLLVEVRLTGTLLNSLLEAAGGGSMDGIRQRLQRAQSYMVIAIDENLLEQARARNTIEKLGVHTVSNLLYLLNCHYPGEAAAYQTNLIATFNRFPMEKRQEHRHAIEDALRKGKEEFEQCRQELERLAETASGPSAEPQRTVDVNTIFRAGSEIHRAALFVATYFAGLNQKDFDAFVHLLLGDESTITKTVRHKFRRDGKRIPIRGEEKELHTDRWNLDRDKVFQKCHLRTVVSSNGSWIVDFCEPHLRDELRSHLETHHPWYLRRQCQRLQTSAILFNSALSPEAVEGLVRVFVDSAVIESAAFGSVGLLALVLTARPEPTDTPPPTTAEEVIAWLSEKQIQALFDDTFTKRLAVLISAMLDQAVLRPLVEEFFEYLLAAKEHDKLLDLVLNLARRIPEFDPRMWMRRLIDEGTEAVRTKATIRLVDLARRSGDRIYEFLASIRNWLPDSDRPAAHYSHSNRVAVDFPLRYCTEIWKRIEPGTWPSEHPLFYALPDDAEKTRDAIAWLLDWLLKPRASATSADEEQMRRVANIIEHWAWVLEGPPSQQSSDDGVKLFGVIVDQLDARIHPLERTFLLRHWEAAANNPSIEGGPALKPGARMRKLEQLRMRFVRMPVTREL